MCSSDLRKTLTPILWEEGANRTWGELPGAGEHALDAAAYPRFPERRWQGAGTAIPVFSLRTEEDFGVGEFYDLKRLIDWAAATGQCVIQVLPINDTTMTGTINSRGYASVFCGGLGTRGSQGFNCCGSPEETYANGKRLTVNEMGRIF